MKPCDGLSGGQSVGFIAESRKATARGVVPQAKVSYLSAPAWGWRGNAPARGQAGADRYAWGISAERGGVSRVPTTLGENESSREVARVNFNGSFYSIDVDFPIAAEIEC